MIERLGKEVPMRIGGLNISSGVLLGAGAVLLAPIVIPVAAGIFKPLAKAAIKGGLITYQKVKETTAEALESMEDLAAEAKAELVEAAEAPAQSKPKKSTKAKAA
jgi:predicted DNA-binding antitoxin AbrB/MazE fold protein